MQKISPHSMRIRPKDTSAGDDVGDDASRAAGLQELTKQSRFPDRLWLLKSASAMRRTIATMARRIEELENDKLQLQAELSALAIREASSIHAARHDVLTGLPNRLLLRERFREATARADRRQSQVLLVFLDVDQFKQVNDRFGHVIGDRVLQMVARRVQTIIRATDTACRYGGDEFVILLADLDHAANSALIAQQIRTKLARPYRVGISAISIQVSIGVTTYPLDGLAWEVLVAGADAAMYRAKQAVLSQRTDITLSKPGS